MKLIVRNLLEKCECKKFDPVHPLKTYAVRRERAAVILNLCNGWSELLAIRPDRFTPQESNQHHSAWRFLPGHRHGKLFIGKPCHKRAKDLLKLSRHLLRLTVAVFTGRAPVRGHLYTLGLSDGDPTCRFCRKETETVQHITCCYEVLTRQRYNVSGNLFVEPKEISTASVRDLCPYVKGGGLLNLS
jgi:hypothetical protein